MTCIFLAERWSRVGDTVSAINCQLARLAAENKHKKKICCVVLKATEEEKKDAAKDGVELILPCLSDDIIDVCENDEPSFKWLLSPDIYFSTLTKLHDVVYIVEHINSSTSFIFASALRKRCFKDADIVLINHGAPSTDKEDKHLKFAEAAAAVFSVGPTVFEEYKKLYQLTNIQIKHKLYLPRPEKAFFDLNVDKISKTSDLKQILTVITDKKVDSTRFKTLAAAVGRTADGFQFMHAKIPKWSVRTSSAASRNDTKTFLNDNLNCACIELNTYPPYGSQDEIYRDLQQSNVLVIPPDEPFRMEALWAIAAGLPVLIPKRTAMAEFLEKYLCDRAEYFLYEPSIEDLSKQISKMLNSPKATGETRNLKDSLQSHTEIDGSHETFTVFLTESQRSNTLPGAAAVSSLHKHSTDDGVGSIEDTSSQQSLSPPPVSSESPVFPQEASTCQVRRESAIKRNRPFMPTIKCEAELDFLEKKMKMEPAPPIGEQRLQLELQTEKDHRQFRKENKAILRAEAKELYELQKQDIIARNNPEKVKELDEAYDKFKARLDAITEGSLQFIISFLSEDDIDYFWQKYKAADVQEVLSGILITPKMRSLAEEAWCTARIRLKIDEKEYEIVKEILHDTTAVYTFSKKNWIRTVAFNKWESYVLDHVHENQAEYLIQQSRFHPILSELRVDDFFYPSFLYYWYDTLYNLPLTLTEATEYAIKHHIQLYCREHKLEVGNVWDIVQDRLYEVGKQVFDNYPQTPQSFLQDAFYDSTFLFDLIDDVKQYHIICFIKKCLHSVHIQRQHIYFYALALYLSKTKNALLRSATFEMCVTSIPTILFFLAGILKEKATFLFIRLTYIISKAHPVNIEQLSLLGRCLLESKCPEKFICTVQQLMKPRDLDLSTSDFDDISHYCLESVASILEQTSIVERLVLVAQNEKSSLSERFKEQLKFQMDNPICDVQFHINNIVELKVVARFIKFHKLFTAQRSVRHLSQSALKSITIRATEDISYNESYRIGQILIRAVASCSYLKLFHLSGFKKTFVTRFLQAIITERVPLTVTRMELPQNELDNSSVSVILGAITHFPFLKQLNVRSNNLCCTGTVALLPLAEKVSVFIEDNGVEESIERLSKSKEVSRQIGDLQLYTGMSEIKTIDDIKKLQSTLEHVTQVNIEKSVPEIIVFLCSGLALFTHLKELDFSGCGMTEESAMVLADGLDYLSVLEHVNLSSNNIGDLGVKYVAIKLENLNSFRSADFTRTNISLRGMIDLHGIIQVSQHKNINVAHNLTELVYVLPCIEHKLNNYPLDVDLQAKTVTLDKLTFIMELNKAGERVSIAKNWEKTEFKHFCEGLKILYMLRYLDLSQGNIGEVGADDFRKAMEWLPRLSYLSLTHNSIGENTAQTIAEGVPMLTDLSDLNLSNNKIQNFGAMKVITGIRKLNKFRNLDLSHNNIQGFGSQIVSEGIVNVCVLEDLDLSNNSIGNEGAESLSTMVEWFPQLRYLSLSQNNIGDDGAGSIGRGVAKLTNLRYFDLSNNKIHNYGATNVVRGIRKLSSLRILDLRHNNIQGFDAEIVDERIVSVCALEYLDLSHNSIGNEGLESLTTIMEWFPQLKYLSLSHNNIEDDGAKRLSAGLLKLTQLKYLGLNHNNIGDIGAREVIRQIRNLVYLESFDLSDNRIGDSAVEILNEVITFMTKSASQDHGHAADKVMQLKYLNLQNNCITDFDAHLLKSTIENAGVDLSVNLIQSEISTIPETARSSDLNDDLDDFVDLSQKEISSFSEYLGKKLGRRSGHAPRIVGSSTSTYAIHGPSTEPKHSSKTAAGYSDYIDSASVTSGSGAKGRF